MGGDSLLGWRAARSRARHSPSRSAAPGRREMRACPAEVWGRGSTRVTCSQVPAIQQVHGEGWLWVHGSLLSPLCLGQPPTLAELRWQCKHCLKCFNFNGLTYPLPQTRGVGTLVLSPFYRGENGGTERLRNSPEVMQPVAEVGSEPRQRAPAPRPFRSNFGQKLPSDAADVCTGARGDEVTGSLHIQCGQTAPSGSSHTR